VNPAHFPAEIAPDECLIRLLSRRDVHPDFRSVKWQAFRPPRGTSRVSVIRHGVGPDVCKDHGLKRHGERYCGFGSLVAASVWAAGFAIYDEPVDFPGHAEIDLGIAWPSTDEVLDTRVQEEVKKRCERLIHHCGVRLILDPDPGQPGWRGGPLCPQVADQWGPPRFDS